MRTQLSSVDRARQALDALIEEQRRVVRYWCGVSGDTAYGKQLLQTLEDARKVLG